MSSTGPVTDALRERGLRITPQRVAILGALRRLANHPSAEEVFRAVRSDFPSLSLTTVYRTLETLAERGEVALVHLGRERARFDHRTDPHHHATCTSCGRLEDVDLAESSIEPGIAIPLFGGRRPRGNVVVFYGVCTPCNERASHEPSARSEPGPGSLAPG